MEREELAERYREIRHFLADQAQMGTNNVPKLLQTLGLARRRESELLKHDAHEALARYAGEVFKREYVPARDERWDPTRVLTPRAFYRICYRNQREERNTDKLGNWHGRNE